MGFGANAFVVAGHAALIGALVLLISRALWIFHVATAQRAVRNGLAAGIAVFGLGLVVERAYYVAARLLAPGGIDLWQKHPVPEMLSLFLVFTLYAVKVPMVLAVFSRRRSCRMIALDFIALAIIWGGTAWVLY